MRTAMKLDQKSIGVITTFENVTKASVLEFFERTTQFVFIVKEGEGGRAIGKGGVNIKKLFYLLKKRIKIAEFSEDPKQFVMNLIAPIKPKTIEQEDNIITITPETTQDKAKLFGRDRNNLKFMNELLQKYHKIEVKVV